MLGDDIVDDDTGKARDRRDGIACRDQSLGRGRRRSAAEVEHVPIASKIQGDQFREHRLTESGRTVQPQRTTCAHRRPRGSDRCCAAGRPRSDRRENAPCAGRFEIEPRRLRLKLGREMSHGDLRGNA
jgi:hypothetical protein